MVLDYEDVLILNLLKKAKSNKEKMLGKAFEAQVKMLDSQSSNYENNCCPMRYEYFDFQANCKGEVRNNLNILELR